NFLGKKNSGYVVGLPDATPINREPEQMIIQGWFNNETGRKASRLFRSQACISAKCVLYSVGDPFISSLRISNVGEVRQRSRNPRRRLNWGRRPEPSAETCAHG